MLVIAQSLFWADNRHSGVRESGLWVVNQYAMVAMVAWTPDFTKE